MKKKLLLSVVASCLFMTTSYADKKIIFASYDKEDVAKSEYDKYLKELGQKAQELENKYAFDFNVRSSGKYFIITAEPFSSEDDAKKVLSLVKTKFPTAFINETDAKKTILSTGSNKESLLKVVDKEILKTTQKTKNYEVAGNTRPFTLGQMLKEVLTTNPEIKERLHQFNSIMEEIEISKAGYLPRADLIAKIGQKSVDEEGIERDEFTSSELTLRVVQNLFNGWGTTSAVGRDEARAKAAFNKYIEVAQDKMYKAIESYLKVLRYAKVLQIAKDNVKLHEETLIKIKDRYDRGFSTLSEVERVRGRLSLAKSNFISETNNLYDAKFNFHKILGRFVDEHRFVEPRFTAKLPETLNHAQDIAIHENPSILVANYDIQVVQNKLKYAQRNDYPTLDVELEANRYDNQDSSTDGKEEDLSAMLVMQYNLYNGGAHKAEKQQYVSLLNYEYEHKNTKKREVEESLNLSWSAYKMIPEQLKYQKNYRNLTMKTKEAYSEEFQLGRRTLIDLLDVQDEVNNIKISVIHSEYDYLFSKYRILDAMGTLYKSFGYEFLNDYKPDEVRAYVDEDADGILNVEDQCDNSGTSDTNIYGCVGVNCVKPEKIEFNKDLEVQHEQNLGTEEVESLWGVK